MEETIGAFYTVIIILVIVLVLFVRPKIINQYERGVVLRMGKYQKTFNPGIHLIVPILQKVTKVDHISAKVRIFHERMVLS